MTAFLPQLSALLAARAARVQPGDPDFASLDLAAHLFAAATYLRSRYGDARMDTSRPAVAIDLDEALEIAASISSKDPVTAYLEMCAALIGIGTFFDSARLVAAPVLPEQTALQPLQDQGRVALFGTVQHWIRPRSPWSNARTHREVICPEVNIYPSTPADQLGALGMVWDRGELPEVRPVRRHDLPPSERTSFRIALCPLFCDAHPRFAVNPEGNQFTIDARNGHSNPAALADYLTALVPHLESADVQLLVLPELSVTEDARTQLAAILMASPCLVGIVAGSFHVWRDGHAAPWNEAVFCVPQGVAWAHHKLGYFRVTARQIEGFRALFTEPLPALQSRVVEGIRHGSVLHFWDTRIGRIAMLICADAIARENMMVAIERCSPDVLLLPSLSTETEAFERLGESLVRRGISVFYVNASAACRVAPNALAAFVHLALPTPKSAPFSRIRWRSGAAPETYGFKARNWLPAPPEQVQVLGNQDGIVIDLAAHLAWRDPDSESLLADVGSEMLQREN